MTVNNRSGLGLATNFGFPIHLICMSLDHGRNRAGRGRTYKHYIEIPGRGDITSHHTTARSKMSLGFFLCTLSFHFCLMPYMVSLRRRNFGHSKLYFRFHQLLSRWPLPTLSRVLFSHWTEGLHSLIKLKTNIRRSWSGITRQNPPTSTKFTMTVSIHIRWMKFHIN